MANNDGKERLVKTFKFLKELHELRSPVARDLSGSEVLRIAEWPIHPSVHVRRGDRQEEDAEDSPDAKIEPLIRIERARLTQCPPPPDILDGWLKPGWQSADEAIDVLESRNFQDKHQQTVTQGFAADPQRVKALDDWTITHAQWAAAERPALAARRLFEKIHSLWSAIQREGDRMELVVADGMLEVAEHFIRHPILIQRLTLEFDPAAPEFIFNAGGERVELHRALLRTVPDIDARMIAFFDKELDEQPIEPLGGDSAQGFLRRVVQGLFMDGEFLESRPRGATDARPRIWREAVIVSRPRTMGLSTTLDCILEDLEREGIQIPVGLSRIVGIETECSAALSNSGLCEILRVPSGPEPDIFFTKSANSEQYEIAAQMEKTQAVLVQGPPGTGKTHTIANLLGYLLSHGKTALVTAHTTKALRVLREQVDEAIRPLALSVLGGDADSQAQLAAAVQEIDSRLAHDGATFRQQAGSLRDERRKLLADADDLRRQLRDARFGEVDEIVIGGEGLSPVEAAKRIKSSAERDGWLPGPLKPGILCPLSEAETLRLYASQAILAPADEAHLAVSQPALERLVGPADFRLLAAEQAGAYSRSQAHRPELWNRDIGSGYSASQLKDLHRRAGQSAAMLAEEQHWLREVLFAGWNGGDLRGAWEDLLAAVDTLASQAGLAHRFIAAYGPELPQDWPRTEIAAILGEIVKFLKAGGAFGLRTKLTQRTWHRLIEECRVEDRVPRTLDEFRALRNLVHLEENRSRFAARWRRTVECLGGPTAASLGSSPERTAQVYAAEIRKRLEWRTAVWEPLIGELRAAGFRWDAWLATHPPVPGDHGELERVLRAASHGLAEVIEAQAALIRQQELSASLRAQRTYLSGFPQSEAASVLLQAQDHWDGENYEEACRELARLEGLCTVYAERVNLLEKVRLHAPAWSDAIAQRRSPHDRSQPPGEVSAAWRWRQWLQELDRRAAVSTSDLQDRLNRIEDDLRRVAALIVEYETWAAQCERTTLADRQALKGFVLTMRKIGRGTGKRVPALLREARQLLESARRAVPVWIMPLSRVYESFDPRTTKFDVVIIDEASQSDVTALAALYLGREHVVVGDQEQVTPDAVGQRLNDVDKLIAAGLQGIPNSHLYDGTTSIYDLAGMAFGGKVVLTEHFRCVPEIIQFSNVLSYQGKIRPLREPLATGIRPALVSHRVNGVRDKGGKRNEIEAEEIASLVIACLDDPEYALSQSGQATSIGVISLLGDEQALLIETLLRSRLSPEMFVKHRLLCGNAAQFQGDERDVVFLSMVDDPPENGQLPLRNAGTRDIFKKRYNVAVSRARDQLWVVHSIDPTAHLKDGDLRRRLIEHARDPQTLMRALEQEGQRTESVFERDVLKRLIAAGYRVHAQWPVGAYRIDLVVEGNARRLAVECDGERWHTPEQLHRDLERQAILERLGWVFIRIRGSLFFRDPDRAMAPVFAKLERLGVEPLGSPMTAAPAVDCPTVERIKRNAESLRAAWLAEKMSER